MISALPIGESNWANEWLTASIGAKDSERRASKRFLCREYLSAAQQSDCWRANTTRNVKVAVLSSVSFWMHKSGCRHYKANAFKTEREEGERADAKCHFSHLLGHSPSGLQRYRFNALHCKNGTDKLTFPSSSIFDSFCLRQQPYLSGSFLEELNLFTTLQRSIFGASLCWVRSWNAGLVLAFGRSSTKKTVIGWSNWDATPWTSKTSEALSSYSECSRWHHL